MTFPLKTPDTKKIFETFCEAFLILKNNLLKASWTYFGSKIIGSFGHPDVRIRDKGTSNFNAKKFLPKLIINQTPPLSLINQEFLTSS
jgi:hypothetical protein